METINIILKISALLAIIVVPLAGPKKKKKLPEEGLSAILVNESGYLEHAKAGTTRYEKVQ